MIECFGNWGLSVAAAILNAYSIDIAKEMIDLTEIIVMHVLSFQLSSIRVPLNVRGLPNDTDGVQIS